MGAIIYREDTKAQTHMEKTRCNNRCRAGSSWKSRRMRISYTVLQRLKDGFFPLGFGENAVLPKT